MSPSELEYLNLCKKQLESKFSFGNGQGYSQKDLELLSNYIEEETGVYISLSTLKRLWKNKFKQGPQLATLNALVRVLGYGNWQQFKLENKLCDPTETMNEPSGRERKGSRLSVPAKLVLVFALFLILATSFAVLSSGKASRLKNTVSIDGPVTFETDKTLTQGVPNTLIFNYDVSHVVADSFFIQQSWNGWRRERIDPQQHVHTSIYHESGFHRARLVANDSIIAMVPVHILSDGWEPHVYYQESDARYIDFNGESFINDGQLRLPDSLLLKRNLDIRKNYGTRISDSRRYGVSSDDFGFVTRVRGEHSTENNCPWLAVLLITEEHIFKVSLLKKGCELYADYKLGEIYRSGQNNDLSALGQDIFKWQEILIQVKDKRAVISINGQEAFTETFQQDFGEIVGITYIFDGKGAIDYVRLSEKDGRLVFEDDFER